MKRNTNPFSRCNNIPSCQTDKQAQPNRHGLNYETEHVEPYAFPAIMESETDTELQGSFSVWTDGVSPSLGDSIVQSEQIPESTSIQLSQTQLSGVKLEDLVEALTQVLNIKRVLTPKINSSLKEKQ